MTFLGDSNPWCDHLIQIGWSAQHHHVQLRCTIRFKQTVVYKYSHSAEYVLYSRISAKYVLCATWITPTSLLNCSLTFLSNPAIFHASVHYLIKGMAGKWWLPAGEVDRQWHESNSWPSIWTVESTIAWHLPHRELTTTDYLTLVYA